MSAVIMKGRGYYVQRMRLPPDLVDRLKVGTGRGRRHALLKGLLLDRLFDPVFPLPPIGEAKAANWVIPASDPDYEDLVFGIHRHGHAHGGFTRCVLLAARDKWDYQPDMGWDYANPGLLIPKAAALPEPLRVRRESAEWLWDGLVSGLQRLSLGDVVAASIQGPLRRVCMPEIPEPVRPVLREASERLLLPPSRLLYPAMLNATR
ncbi:hypothetical protein [Acidithiobacillus sp.]|uniref:hypothetical protein n=1 Tax=Acidithiobacillus sp. TaxID=1872118 RepID=UPI003D0776F2